MNLDLKIIKKYYGEDMMHYARDNFSIILEKEGRLSKIFLDNFAESKTLYEDLKENNELVKFKNYIYKLYYKKIDEDNNEITNVKTPTELMSDAGYNLCECETEGDIQSFKKYYSKGEELCTFKGGRLDSNRVFFAVKKNVDNIKRENFKNPEREDEYGTSVISIQFTKDETNTLSIKNRYNHIVRNPDATFSNNLDNIVKGLTKSFEVHYGIKQKYINEEHFTGFVRANDGKYYKYNYEIDNKYYCPNNIIIDNFVVKKYPTEKYIVIDYFILDLVKKEIESYCVIDSFPNTIKNIKKIEIKRLGIDKIINISVDDSDENIEIIIDKNNRIISYKNNIVKYIDDDFLIKNEILENIILPNVRKIGDNFLLYNKALDNINLSNVQIIGDNFLHANKNLKEIYLPSVLEIGDNFLLYNKALDNINLPNVQIIGDYFLNNNKNLKEIYLPSVLEIGDYFLIWNKALDNINLPNVQIIGDDFLNNNKNLKEIYLPNVLEIGNYFLNYNKVLEKIYMPKVEYIKHKFLPVNTSIKVFNAPNLISLGEDSFCYFLFSNGYCKVKFIDKELLIKLKKIFKRKNFIAKLKKSKKEVIQNIYNKKKILKK